ncbi:MAG: tetratricopeptide repeat protein, partial [Desulfovibrio sp.]|nr:tetratricopeptide repeat protein [Desulfovibrio sp.]
DEAVRILESGIGFHPDHLEAKFLLVELFSRQGKEEEAVGIFSGVQESLIRYPAVWRLWSRHAAFASRDPVLALAFLAQYFRDPGLTFADVLEKGLEVVSGTALPSEEAVEAPIPEAGVPIEPELEVSAMEPCRPGEEGAMPLRGADEVRELAGLLEGGGVQPAAPEAPAAVISEPSGIAGQQEAGIRTKTMASLLASQGDIQGALDIYVELSSKLPPGPERDEIEARIAELSAGGGAAVIHMPSAQKAGAASGAKGKAKLIGLLDVLAGRLEARLGS